LKAAPSNQKFVDKLIKQNIFFLLETQVGSYGNFFFWIHEEMIMFFDISFLLLGAQRRKTNTDVQ